jgi:hypothetical protein
VIDFLTTTIGSFLGIGIYERYFKGASIAFWKGVEYKVLNIVFKTMDSDFIETLNSLKDYPRPEIELKKLVKSNIEKAAKELNIITTDKQLEDWSNKFGELYNPYISLSKRNKNINDN